MFHIPLLYLVLEELKVGSPAPPHFPRGYVPGARPWCPPYEEALPERTIRMHPTDKPWMTHRIKKGLKVHQESYYLKTKDLRTIRTAGETVQENLRTRRLSSYE